MLDPNKSRTTSVLARLEDSVVVNLVLIQIIFQRFYNIQIAALCLSSLGSLQSYRNYATAPFFGPPYYIEFYYSLLMMVTLI